MEDKQLRKEEGGVDAGTAIAVSHVSKTYKLYDKPMDRLKEALKLTRQQKYREAHALSDISFDVGQGGVRRDHRDKRFRQVYDPKDYNGCPQSHERQRRCQRADLCAVGAGRRF